MRRRPAGMRQRGVAVVTALLLTTLAVTIVTSLFWQQQVQVRSMENQRLHLQTRWILRGALDWARLILRQDGRDNGRVTTLDGVWATPLAETRLDQYIERERVEGEAFDATISGQVIDAQSRYNLTNLATDGIINDKHVEVFGRLLSNLQLDPALAKGAAQVLASGQVPGPAGGGGDGDGDGGARRQGGAEPIKFVQLDDLLAVPGFTPAAVQRLREFATVLPAPTKVNVNTAAAEVLAAVIEFSPAEANALTASRKRAYFKDVLDFKARLNGKTPLADELVDVKSEYFLVSSRVRLERAAFDAQALIRRDANLSMRTTLVSIREL